MEHPLRPLKWYKTLATEKGRHDAMAFAVEGERAISQIAGIRPGEILEIVSTSELAARWSDFPVRQVAASKFDQISSTVTPQGIMAVVRLPYDAHADKLPANAGARILLLEDVQDPGNVGALIRTAAAFAYSGVILSERCADPFSPKSVQATAGAIMSVWLRRTSRYLEMVKKLKADGYSIATADVNAGKGPDALHKSDQLLLALGSETAGPSADLLGVSDHRFRIPIAREKAESLNVAASGAICMYLTSMNSAVADGQTAAGRQGTRPHR